MTTHDILEDLEGDEEFGPVLLFLAASARLIFSVAVTLLGLVTLTFFISRLLPLDPVVAMLGDNISQEAYDMMYRKLGLDQPLIVQYGLYLKNAV
ncbi:hypothetical protein NY486_01850, partial [Enterobacter hormaechei]|nr:hypothetical protein [Enterobacter hormaechei]